MKIKALVYILCSAYMAILASCYRTYTALNSIVFTNIDKVGENIHSEYFYGKCATRYKSLMIQEHLTYDDIKGKVVVRGYLNSPKKITCVHVRSQSPVTDMVKYRRVKFTMCLSKIRYQYTGAQYFHHFYEWFLPVDMKKELEWDLYFYHS